MRHIKRLLKNKVLCSIKAFPVVYIAGPRQSGKTTLVKAISQNEHPAQYLTFDDAQVRAAAQYDPTSFLNAIKGPVVLDEIQLVPELFRPLKIFVDENRDNPDGGRGQFLLTGSASIMALPALSDALVGRMALHTLYPFSALELSDKPAETFIERVFSDQWRIEKIPTQDTIKIMMDASYPELLQLNKPEERYSWCNGYLSTIIQRDVQALLEIEKLGAIPNLLQLIASRTGGLLNESGLSRDASINHITVKKYRLLLDGLFLIQSIPAWATNLGKRLIKAPKVYIGDLNLLSYLINTSLPDLRQNNTTLFGQVVENYVAIELSKQLTFSAVHANLYHYRSASGQEIDFILEGPNNQIVGIEVKAKSHVTAHDFQQLRALQHELGSRFARGFVLYLGNEVLPFGPNLWAIPVMSMWSS